MYKLITKGVKISVKTLYKGTAYKESTQFYHRFEYFITIENCSKNTIQLIERYWNIFDSLQHPKTVQGYGVVGQNPILQPNETYSYSSNCLLISSIGSMNGYFKMIVLSTEEELMVRIPTFQFIANPKLN